MSCQRRRCSDCRDEGEVLREEKSPRAFPGGGDSTGEPHHLEQVGLLQIPGLFTNPTCPDSTTTLGQSKQKQILSQSPTRLEQAFEQLNLDGQGSQSITRSATEPCQASQILESIESGDESDVLVTSPEVLRIQNSEEEEEQDDDNDTPEDSSTTSRGSWETDERSEHSSPSPVHQHPLFDVRSQVLDFIFSGFEAYRRATQRQSGDSDSPRGQSSSHQASSQPSRTTNARKRRTPEDEDQDDGNGSSNRRKKARNETQILDDQVTFACPFSKRHPARHQRCNRYKLSRIRDVKQHLKRRHLVPIYCSICGTTFDDEKTRDSHARKQKCPHQPLARIEGVTTLQCTQLSTKVSSKLSEEEQWFAVYAVVFPGHPRPRSPYIDRQVPEELQSFTDYFVNEGPRIILEALRSHPLGDGANQDSLINLLGDRANEDFHLHLLGNGLQRIREGWRNVPLGPELSTQSRSIIPASVPVPIPSHVPISSQVSSEENDNNDTSESLSAHPPPWPPLDQSQSSIPASLPHAAPVPVPSDANDNNETTETLSGHVPPSPTLDS